jgi:serine/threonine protein kinase
MYNTHMSHIINLKKTMLTVGHIIYETYDGYTAMCTYNKTQCVVKVMHYDLIHGIKPKVLREIHALKKLRHKNIVKMLLHEVDDVNHVVYIVYEWCGISLLNIQHDKIDKKKFMDDISSALSYVHSMGYSHCDVTLANITLTVVEGIQIFTLIDFGNCVKTSRTTCNVNPTIYIVPPELLNKKGTLDIDYNLVDAWAVGCIYYYLSTGNPLAAEVTKEMQYCELIERFGIRSQCCDFIIDPLKCKSIRDTCDDNYVINMLNINRRKRSKINTITPFTDNTRHHIVKNKFARKTQFDHNPNALIKQLIDICVCDMLSIENVFITMKLLKKISLISYVEYIKYAIVLFTLVVKNVSGITYTHDDINHMISNLITCHAKDDNINKLSVLILNKLKWNINAKTMYDSKISIVENARILICKYSRLNTFQSKQMDNIMKYYPVYENSNAFNNCIECK